ncbi:MAG TPA: hypothetical protein VH054_14350, partial [Polyangiaceae bacterium]|nr:hypothetical protein [Polyangiaceae bacterium]
MKKIFFLALVIACGRDNALVDGECADGYTLVGSKCVAVDDAASDATNDAGDATSGDVITNDTTTDTTPSDVTPSDVITDAFQCDDGLTLCSGTCVDTTSDPFNCGACSVVCPSLLCGNSQCVGSVAGSFVVIGHDFGNAYSAAQGRVLANSLLLTTATNIRVRSYEQYSAAGAVANAKAVMNAAAAGAGRTITYTVATQPTDVSTGMTALNTDVLVVYDQSGAPASTLAGIGSGWAVAIASFAHVGGVVIVLDGQGGTSPQMPDLIKNAGILDVSADTTIAQNTALDVVAPSDAVGIGVVSPYGAAKNSVYFTCNEANVPPVTYVIEDAKNDAGPT